VSPESVVCGTPYRANRGPPPWKLEDILFFIRECIETNYMCLNLERRRKSTGNIRKINGNERKSMEHTRESKDNKGNHRIMQEAQRKT